MTDLSDHFVDISDNNPLPNLDEYKNAGHVWLCRKVSEGIGYHWVQGDTVADEWHSRGGHVIHYHWLRPDSDPTAQAAYFVRLLDGHVQPGDKVMCDFEATSGVGDPADVTRASQLHTFCAYVTEHMPGVSLLVYTGLWYIANKPAMTAEVKRWPVIVSGYVANVPPNPYGLHYAAWQFTDRAVVAGFSRPLDYNRWLINPGGRMLTDEQILKAISDAQYGAYEGGDIGVWKEADHVWLHKRGDGYNGRLVKHFYWFKRLWARLAKDGVK